MALTAPATGSPLVEAGVTVLDDGVRDVLEGNGGRDLFFAGWFDDLLDDDEDEDMFWLI